MTTSPYATPNVLVEPTQFVHAGHTVKLKSKPSDRFGALFSADITRPDGTELFMGSWFFLQSNARAEAIATIERQAGVGPLFI